MRACVHSNHHFFRFLSYENFHLLLLEDQFLFWRCRLSLFYLLSRATRRRCLLSYLILCFFSLNFFFLNERKDLLNARYYTAPVLFKFPDSIIYSVVLSCFVMLVKSFPWLKLMIKTPTNGTIKLTLPCTKGIDWYVCEESR